MTGSDAPARSRDARRADKTFGALVVLVCAFWAAVGAYSVHASMPTNTLKLPLERQLNMREVLPQGWAFFTRDPREAPREAYVKNEQGRFVPATPGSNGDAVNLFGLSRRSRAQSIEMGMLIKEVAGSDWTRCRVDPGVCLADLPVIATVESRYPGGSLCGAVGLVEQRFVPWAWQEADEPIEMPSRVARLWVKC